MNHSLGLLMRHEHAAEAGEPDRRGAEGGRLIWFAGTTPNVGTTVAALSAASAMAARTGTEIGYLCLNLKSSKLHRYLGCEEPAASLDSIRGDIKARGLTPVRLMQACYRPKGKRHLSILFGNLLREQAELFTPEDMEYVFAAARACFPVTILDVNAYWDNAATVCGALSADLRIAVTTEQLGHFQEDVERGVKPMARLLGIPPESIHLMVRRQSPGRAGGGYSLQEIRRETGMPVLGGLRDYPDLPDRLNTGQLLAWLEGNRLLHQDLTPAVHLMAAACGLQTTPRAAGSFAFSGRRLWPRWSLLGGETSGK